MNYIVFTLGSEAWRNKTNLRLRDELFYSSKTQSPGMNFKISKLVYIFATLLDLVLPLGKLFFIHYDIFHVHLNHLYNQCIRPSMWRQFSTCSVSLSRFKGLTVFFLNSLSINKHSLSWK